MSGITTRRSLTYWVFLGLFLLGGGPIFSSAWTISPFLHNSLDGLTVMVSIAAALLAYTAYRKTGATALAIAATGLAGAAVFELLHELADTALLAPLLTSEATLFAPWTWQASRVFLGVGLLAATLHVTKDNFGASGTVARNSFPSPRLFALFMLVMVVVGAVALVSADLPSINSSSVGLIRLPEIITGSMLLVALLLFVRRGNWRTDSYGHWMNIALVASINAQFFCMAFSQQELDASFAAAHLLKIVSYACFAFGFASAHSTSAAVRDEDLSKPKGLGLGVKVGLLCGFIGFICVMPIAIKSSQTLHEIAAVNSMEHLSATAANTGAALNEQRRRVDADLEYLATTKIMAGLNQAIQSSGVDSASGKTTRGLVIELSRLAQNLLFSDPDYLALTYIDAASGETIFRSEQRQGAGVAALNRPTLQSSERKLAERSLAAGNGVLRTRSNIFAIGAASTADARSLKVEGATLNVYSSDTGAVLGTLVMHSDLSPVLRPASQTGAPTLAYVVNSNGEFLLHPDPDKEVSSDALATTTETVAGTERVTGIQSKGYLLSDEFPGLDFVTVTQRGAMNTQSAGSIYERPDGEEIVVGFNRADAAAGPGEMLLYINTGLREDLEQNAAAIGYQLQQIAQFNLLVAIAIGWFFARRFAKPVQVISAAAVEFGRTGKVAELPVSGRDEIGLLGKSLSDMMNEVASQRDKLLLLSSAVESSVSSTIITTIYGDIEYVNPHYEQYAGIKAADVVGKNIRELREFVENRNILSKAPARKGGEQVWTGELQTRRADGRLHDESITISPIRNAAGENINQSMIIEDITERRAMEKYIEGKTAELQRSNRDLEQFAYVASHDLKAPLRAIEVLVSWLKDDLEGYEDGDVQENLDLLRRRTVRLSRLLDDLLAYSRAGRKIGDIKLVKTREFVEDIGHLISPPEGFTIEVADDLPTITTYHAPLETVFRNLMSNAVKHSPEPADGRIRVYAEDRGDMVEFAVEDNGLGIPQEYADKVFKMFQTLQARDEKEGSGMGLAIVQRIIDWQGGRIWFHAGPDNKGTVFRFTWHKTPPAMPDVAAPADDAEDALSTTQSLRAQAAQESAAEREAQFGDEFPEEQSAGSTETESTTKPDLV